MYDEVPVSRSAGRTTTRSARYLDTSAEVETVAPTRSRAAVRQGGRSVSSVYQHKKKRSYSYTRKRSTSVSRKRSASLRRRNLYGYGYHINVAQPKAFKFGRPSPGVSATLFAPGTVRRGNNGAWWMIRTASNGTQRWVPAMSSYSRMGGASAPAPATCPAGMSRLFSMHEYGSGKMCVKPAKDDACGGRGSNSIRVLVPFTRGKWCAPCPSGTNNNGKDRCMPLASGTRLFSV